MATIYKVLNIEENTTENLTKEELLIKYKGLVRNSILSTNSVSVINVYKEGSKYLIIRKEVQ